MKKILIAGPCVHEESVQWLVDQAGAIFDAACAAGYGHQNFIFKCSFDKANRTELVSYRGLGLDKTLEAFALIQKVYDIRVTTDIHEVWQAHEVAPVVDVIQIPAMLSRQTDLITAAARKGVVNIKVGTNMTADQAEAALHKANVHNGGNGATWLTYRGTAFGSELVFDPNRLWDLMGRTTLVLADVTHSAVNAKHGRLVNARVAAALGIDGLFIECHPNPEKALSDSATQLAIRNLGPLLEGLTWPN